MRPQLGCPQLIPAVRTNFGSGRWESSFNSLLLNIWFSEHVLSFFSLTRVVFLSQFNHSSGVQSRQSAAHSRGSREQGCGGCPFSLLLASLACPLPGPSLQPALLLHAQSLSRVQLFATPWTIPHQAPLSMGFPRQEYWSGLPFPSPGDLPNPGIGPMSPVWQTSSLSLCHLGNKSLSLCIALVFLPENRHYTQPRLSPPDVAGGSANCMQMMEFVHVFTLFKKGRLHL